MGCGASKTTSQVEPSATGKPSATPAVIPPPTDAAAKPTPAVAKSEPPLAKPAAAAPAKPEPAKPAAAAAAAAPPASTAAAQPVKAAPVTDEITLEPAKPAALPINNVPKKLVLVLGGPGTGVSEQCAKLSEVYNCQHLVVGKLMRAEVMSESAEGKSIATMMNEGKIIPAPVYTALYKKTLATLPLEPADEGTPVATCLLDGFPRSADNLRLFNEHVGTPHAVLVLHAPDEVSRERAARLDNSTDDAAAFGKRLESYAKRTVPMIEQLEASGLNVQRIDAAGSDAHVFARMVLALGWQLPAGMEPPPPSAAAAAVPAAARPTPPAVSLDPADDTPLKSVTGAKLAPPKPADGPASARAAVVVLGSDERALAAALGALVAEKGYTEVGLKQALEAGVASGAQGAAALAADLEAGKLIPSDLASKLLDAAMAGAGPYAIRATGAGAALAALLSSTAGLAPVALCFGAPADGEAELAAACSTAGRKLVTIAEADAAAAVGAAMAALGGGVSASQVLFVLGGPGSGKGTQCALLAKHFGYAHFSAGDLLRDEVASGSAAGVEIGEMIKEGKIVPGKHTIDLLKKAMGATKGPYLIDGFPRSMDNAKSFEEAIGVARGVLFFEVSESVLEARLLERGQTSGRTDDNKESIMKRFKTFESQSLPVVDYLATITKVHKISGEQPPDEVFKAVCAALEHQPPA